MKWYNIQLISMSDIFILSYSIRLPYLTGIHNYRMTVANVQVKYSNTVFYLLLQSKMWYVHYYLDNQAKLT